MYSIIYTKTALKALCKYDRIVKNKIEEKLLNFINNKLLSDIKKLRGKEKDLYRLRIGKYRVIFEKQDDKLIILVLDIGSRGEVYK